MRYWEIVELRNCVYGNVKCEWHDCWSSVDHEIVSGPVMWTAVARLTKVISGPVRTAVARLTKCGLEASPLVDKEKWLELIKPDLAWVCYCDSRMRTLRVLLRILHLWNNMFFVYYIKMWFWHLYVMHVCTLFLNKN